MTDHAAISLVMICVGCGGSAWDKVADNSGCYPCTECGSLNVRFMSDEEVEELAFKKHGVGEVLPDAGDQQKTASKQELTDEEQEALARENADADKE